MINPFDRAIRYTLAYSGGPSALARCYHDVCTPPALSEKFRQTLESAVIPWHQKVAMRERLLQEAIDEEGCSAIFTTLKTHLWENRT